MAYDQFHQINATSQMIEVALRSATTGQLLTGVAFGSVTAKYVREGSNTQVTVSVVTATQGTFTSGGWVETGIAGVYQFGIPDAALAAGAKAVTLVFSASGAIDVVKRVLLVVEDLREVLVSSRLAPATAGRTLAVAATGEAAANVTYSAGVALSGRLAEYADLPAVWDEAISGHLTSGTTGAALNTAASASGAGSTAYSNTVTDSDSNPLDGVEVWITTDSGGASTVASTTTDTLGAFTVYLDPGTYYLWLAKGGYNFPNPTTITVS